MNIKEYELLSIRTGRYKVLAIDHRRVLPYHIVNVATGYSFWISQERMRRVTGRV